MAQQIINIGLYDNDPNADNLRVGGDKINENFTELYTFSNNKMVYRNIGLIAGSGVVTNQEVADKINASGTLLTVFAYSSPVIIVASKFTGDVNYKYVFVFASGKGVWGPGEKEILPSSFRLLSTTRLTPEDIADDPNAVIENIDPVVNGDFVTKANQSIWDFSDSKEPQPDGGLKSYYFTYTDKGILYFALFDSTPGIYGGGGTPFTIDQFKISTNSSITPEFSIPEWKAGIYPESSLVTKNVNGQKYLFKSNENSNETEPLLRSNKPAWENHFGGVYVGVWNNATAYVSGDIVNREGYAYWCASNNTNTDPNALLYNKWIKLGKFIGAYNPVTLYKNGDVVTDGTDILISNYDNNNYPLDYGRVSKWDFINGDANTIVSLGDSMTEGTGSTGDGNYPAQLSKRLGKNVLNMGVAGETSTQIRSRFFAMPNLWHLSFIFWAGRNNAGDAATVLADIAAMVEALPHDRYVVVGVTKHVYEDNTQVDDLNAQLEAIYGDRFIDAQAFLFSIYDPTIPQDVANHASGYLAWSILSDNLHLNNKGYFYVAKLIASRFLYLQGTPKIKMTVDPYSLPLNLPAKGLMMLSSGEFVTAPSIGSGYIPFENGQGIPNTSGLYFDGINTGANTGSDIEDGWKLQVNGSFAAGNKGSARFYGFTLDAETYGIQIRDIGYQKNLKLYIEQLLVGNAAIATANGEAAVFSGEIKIPNGTLSSSGVNKSQIDLKADLVGGTVPASQLPSYVDDVLEYANLAAFPVTGESGKIYVANDTNLTYRWSGSSYVGLSISLALGETAGSAYRGDRGKIAYDHSQTSGNPHNTTISDIPGLTDALPVILKLTQNIDFPDLGSHSYSDVEFDFTSAAMGDCVDVFAPVTLILPRVYYTAWVSAVNKVTVRVTNTDAPSVSMPAGDFKLRIIK